MRLPIPALVTLTTLAACGGDGTSATSGPSDLPDAAGRYTGAVTYGPATPAEHCFSMWLTTEGAPTGRHGFRVALELAQDGPRVTGALTGLDIPMTCELRGNLAGRRLTLSQTGCSVPCTRFSHPTLATVGCEAIDVCTTTVSFDGVSNGRIVMGDHSVTWETTVASTGAPAGTVEITATLSVSR